MATTVTFPWSANPEIKQGICRSRGFTLQFGSFEPVAIDWVQEGANILQKYHEAMCDFDEACIDMIRNRSNDRVVKRHGVLKYAPKTPTMLRKERRRARLERERKDFLNAPDQYVTEICFPPEAPKRMETPSIRFPPVVVRKKRVAPQRQSVAISHAGFDNLLRELTVVCREMNKPLEFVGSARGLVRANIVKPSPFESRLVCVTKHHEGIIQSIDVHVPNTVRAIFTRIAQLAWKGPIIHEWDCKIGDSGVCIPKGKLKSPSRTINENLFIVRGAYRNELQDAQQALPLYKYMRMVHF
nr:P1 protein [Wild tomato mosaic virus]